MPGWAIFQSATLGQFCIGANIDIQYSRILQSIITGFGFAPPLGGFRETKAPDLDARFRNCSYMQTYGNGDANPVSASAAATPYAAFQSCNPMRRKVQRSE